MIVPATFKSPSIDADVLTTNPKFGEIDAVAEPLAILFESPVKLEKGISNKFLPLPLNEPVTNSTLP